MKQFNALNEIKVEKEDEGKDWRHCFKEQLHPAVKLKLCEYSYADAIEVSRAGDCTHLRPLMMYVTQFTQGGMWVDDDKVHFVTQGVDSDNDASYEDAKEFMRRFEALQEEI